MQIDQSSGYRPGNVKIVIDDDDSSVETDFMKPLQQHRDILRDLFQKQRSVQTSVFDVLNRINQDAELKKRKQIKCEEFFAKLLQHLETLRSSRGRD